MGDEAYPEWFQGVPDTAPDHLLKRLKSSFDRSVDVLCIEQPGRPGVWTCKSDSVGTDGDHFGYKVKKTPSCLCLILLIEYCVTQLGLF